MKFDSRINKYIMGEKFSHALYIPFSPHKFEDIDRPYKIIQIVKNTRVIHIGCCDHLPLIEEKIRKKRWLHKLLVENTQKCIGIDINQEAVEYVVNKLNIKDVFCLDILKDDIDLNNEMWDYVILGELIEHVDNPVDFLQTIKQKFQGKVKKIIITAPNVLNILYAKYIKRNLECINTDHRYWFSPFTLSKITTISGFNNCELTYAHVIKQPFFKAVIRFIKKKLNIKRYYTANHFYSIILIADF